MGIYEGEYPITTRMWKDILVQERQRLAQEIATRKKEMAIVNSNTWTGAGMSAAQNTHGLLGGAGGGSSTSTYTAQQTHAAQMAQVYANTTSSVYPLIHKLKMRLNLPLHHNPFALFEAIEDGGVAFVCIICNGKSVVLEDDPNMFPSDRLVTQVRLLLP